MKHKAFGEGTVVKPDSKYIRVQFKMSEKMFPFSDSIRNEFLII